MLTSPTFSFWKYLNYCFLCSFGDYVVPNKNLTSCDQYQGQWKDGKMHGFGTFRFVVVFIFVYNFYVMDICISVCAKPFTFFFFFYVL